MKQGGGSKRRWLFALVYYNAGLAFCRKAGGCQAVQRAFCTASGIATEGGRVK